MLVHALNELYFSVQGWKKLTSNSSYLLLYWWMSKSFLVLKKIIPEKHIIFFYCLRSLHLLRTLDLINGLCFCFYDMSLRAFLLRLSKYWNCSEGGILCRFAFTHKSAFQFSTTIVVPLDGITFNNTSDNNLCMYGRVFLYSTREREYSTDLQNEEFAPGEHSRDDITKIRTDEHSRDDTTHNFHDACSISLRVFF